MSTSVELGQMGADLTRDRERRLHDRYPLDAATGSLVYKGSAISCRFIDISLGGCCLRTEVPFVDGALAPVVVILRVQGLVLRIGGVTQWITQGNLLGVRFNHCSARSKNQLAGLLTCLIDQSAAEVVKEAVAGSSPGQTAIPLLIAEAPSGELEPIAAPAAPGGLAEYRAPHGHSEDPVHQNQPRTRLSLEEEWPATVRFLKDNSQVTGLILDLTLEGCNVRTAQPFPLGIHVRVELNFHMRGLPFQLAGVTHDLSDKHIVAIRFLEMSRRKQGELGQVIDELKEARERAAE